MRGSDEHIVIGDEFCGDDDLLSRRCYPVYLASPFTGLAPELVELSRSLRLITALELRDHEMEDGYFQHYDPEDVTGLDSPHTPDEVYAIDYTRSMDADLVIFFVIGGSWGGGMEAQISAEATVPKVVVAPKQADISRMIPGLFNPTLAEIRFENPRDYEQELQKQLPRIATAVRDSAKWRAKARRKIERTRIGGRILIERTIRNIHLRELAERTDIRWTWLARLERNDGLSACMTIIALVRIAGVLDCEPAMGKEGIPTLQSPEFDYLPGEAQESLWNLVGFVRSDPGWRNDQVVVALGHDYYVEVKEAAKTRKSGKNAISPVRGTDWWAIEYHKKLEKLNELSGQDHGENLPFPE